MVKMINTGVFGIYMCVCVCVYYIYTNIRVFCLKDWKSFNSVSIFMNIYAIWFGHFDANILMLPAGTFSHHSSPS